MSSHVITDVLVTTDWVAQHAADTGTRVVEVDVDTAAYDQGHVPGAAGWNWTTDLCDTHIRDIVPADNLEALLGRTGIDNDPCADETICRLDGGQHSGRRNRAVERNGVCRLDCA